MPWSLRMVLYSSIILTFILFYFGYRYLRSVKATNLQPSWFYKSLLFISAALFLTYPAAGLIEFWLKGSFDRTGYPNFLIYLFWYSLVCMGTMVNWLILHDLMLPFYKKISGKTQNESTKIFARFFLIFTIITFLFTAAKMYWDTNRIITEKIHYVIPNIQSAFEPLTIIHIADLHADKYTRETKMERYINKINDFEPDLVIFAGDLITSGTEHIETGARMMGKIESTYGIFAVLGDHDFWTDTDFIISELEAIGVTVLENQNIWIDHHGSSIKITGVTELYSVQVRADTLQALLQETRGEQLRLFSSHQATDELIEQTTENGVHQLLAGHTHGGQIRVPVFFYPVTAARSETKYVNGHWLLDGMLLNINNGLGFTLAPVRYHAPAQISVIRVQG